MKVFLGRWRYVEIYFWWVVVSGGGWRVVGMRRGGHLF